MFQLFEFQKSSNSTNTQWAWTILTEKEYTNRVKPYCAMYNEEKARAANLIEKFGLVVFKLPRLYEIVVNNVY